MLDDKDLEQISKLIAESMSAILVKTKQPKKPRKPYKKRQKKVDKPPKSVIIKEVPQVARIRKVGKVLSHGPVQGTKGKICRTESFDTSGNRPNKFIGSADAKLFKNDTKIDKKLIGNNQPVPRRQETKLWEVDCQVCGRPSIVSPTIIMVDPDNGSIHYTCDNCIKR